MPEVLLLGNGISRLIPEHLKFIDNWEGELWGCNYAYLEYAHKLTRISGHTEVIEQSGDYRRKHAGYEYAVVQREQVRDIVLLRDPAGLVQVLGSDHRNRAFCLPEDAENREWCPYATYETLRITCPIEHRHETGCTIFAQALEEGYSAILCGYDLGGRDVYTHDNHLQRKDNWITNMRNVLTDYGTARVRFLGHDHMPFLLSDEAPETYANVYCTGAPHIADLAYRKVFNKLYRRRNSAST